MHQPPPRGVVGALELGTVADPADADPLPAVVGLHEQRVADLLGDRGQVERLVVPGGRVLEAGVVRRVLVRDQHRRRHLQPEADHRAVGRVLLHRLERERAVEQVHVVHQRDLLEPLAREVVPVREPVDHQLVARPVAQVEWLHRDPLGGDPVAVPRGVGDRARAARRASRTPVGQSSSVPSSNPIRCVVSVSRLQSDRSVADDARAGRATTANRARRRTPTGPARSGSPWICSSAAKRRVDSSAPVVSSH